MTGISVTQSQVVITTVLRHREPSAPVMKTVAGLLVVLTIVTEVVLPRLKKKFVRNRAKKTLNRVVVLKSTSYGPLSSGLKLTTVLTLTKSSSGNSLPDTFVLNNVETGFIALFRATVFERGRPIRTVLKFTGSSRSGLTPPMTVRQTSSVLTFYTIITR